MRKMRSRMIKLWGDYRGVLVFKRKIKRERIFNADS